MSLLNTAMAPPAMEFAWYLAISWAQIDAAAEEIVADFRAVSGERFDARALDLGFLLALAHLGWNKALAATENPDADARSREVDHCCLVGRPGPARARNLVADLSALIPHELLIVSSSGDSCLGLRSGCTSA